MRTLKFLIFLALLATLLGNAAPQSGAAQESTQAPTPKAASPIPPPAVDVQISIQHNVSYGVVDGHELLLDIYQPAAASVHPRAAVILIHGGGWTNFDKSTMAGMGSFLARSDFVAFSVDYRLLHGTENRWPAQLDDVQRAVRWVRANAAKYNVDQKRIGAFGHSAGAQLAALLGLEDTRDNSDSALAQFSSQVEAVVDQSGPSDFTVIHDPEGLAFLAALFGVDYATKPDVWRDASPVFHVSKTSSAFLVVHGTRDESVPIAQAQELVDKLQAAGVPVKFVKLDDGHMITTTASRQRLAIETLEFLRQYLAAPQ
jgi:acetyl esterase/lipase